MKQNRTITTLIVSALCCFAFAACEKENTNLGGNSSGGNNNGSVITDDDTGIELNMSNSGVDQITFTMNYVSNGSIYTDARCWITMTSSNNFVLNSNYNAWIEYDIASVGQVSGLSSIKNIPSAGWVKQIAVNPGTGYVVRYKGNGFSYTYARIYVKDWMVNTAGGIMGATVKYQDKWGQANGSNALFGTTWNYSEQFSEGDVEYSSSLTVQFSSTSYSGTFRSAQIYSNGEYYTEEANFTYTYGENGHGEMFVVFNDGYGYTTESIQFFVEGDTMTLLYTDTETGETYTVAVLSKQ